MFPEKELAECHDTNDRIDKEISETTHSINRLAEQAQERKWAFQKLFCKIIPYFVLQQITRLIPEFEVLNMKREKVRLLTEQLQAKVKQPCVVIVKMLL